jgi:T5SS/PEP-CTERM-associated repeat protein
MAWFHGRRRGVQVDVGRRAYVGYYGLGVVNITGGGTVTGGGGSIGFGAGSTGVVNVDGADSLWNMDYNSSLTVGYQGAASVNVTRGGHVDSGEYTIIGYMLGSVGAVRVDGLSSRWYSSGYIELGGGDGGTLSVTDQASVVSALPIYVRSRGEVRGNGVIDADVENGGLVAPGPGAGALSINGYYTQKPEGVLEIELGGTNDYDQLLANPNAYIATLDGTLEVKLIDGFTPLVGQTFTIVSAYDVDGMFSTLVLPTMPGRRFDVIYNPQSVVLRVALNLGGGAAASSVPEPGALALALLVGGGLAVFRPRRR